MLQIWQNSNIIQVSVLTEGVLVEKNKGLVLAGEFDFEMDDQIFSDIAQDVAMCGAVEERAIRLKNNLIVILWRTAKTGRWETAFVINESKPMHDLDINKHLPEALRVYTP